MFDLIGKAANLAVNTAVDTVTAPVHMAGNALDIAGGLTEGEIRIEAICDLGEEVVKNMTQAEILEWYRSVS